MIFRFLLVFVAVVLVVILVHRIRHTSAEDLKSLLKRMALWAGVIAVVLLVVTGRLHWLFALVASALPFLSRLLGLLRYVPILSQLVTSVQNARAATTTSSASSSERQSQVRSQYFDMTLDHDSGAMDGEILRGDYQGRVLSGLTEVELKSLLQELSQADQESRALFGAYLKRHHPDIWTQAEQQQTDNVDTDKDNIDIEQAAEILGISRDSSEQGIINAHRRLMQVIHPDRGGSSYLATKINIARDTMLSNIKNT